MTENSSTFQSSTSQPYYSSSISPSPISNSQVISHQTISHQPTAYFPLSSQQPQTYNQTHQPQNQTHQTHQPNNQTNQTHQTHNQTHQPQTHNQTHQTQSFKPANIETSIREGRISNGHQSAGSFSSPRHGGNPVMGQSNEMRNSKLNEIAPGSNRNINIHDLKESTTPRSSARPSYEDGRRIRFSNPVVVNQTETIIEHPPILRSVIERSGVVYTSSSVHQQPRSSYKTTVQERMVEKRDSSSSETKTITLEEYLSLLRYKEKYEELVRNQSINKVELQSEEDKTSLERLRKENETLGQKFVDLEERLKKTIRERDEIGYKLENRQEVNAGLKEKVSDFEQEAKELKARIQKLESERVANISEKTEVEANLRKINSELVNKLSSSEISTSDLKNRLQISEEKNRHLEKRLLDADSDMAKYSRDYKDLRDKQIISSSNTTEKTITKLVQQPPSSELDSYTLNLISQLKEKNVHLEEMKMKVENLESKYRISERSLGELCHQIDSDKIRNQSQVHAKETEINGLLSKVEEANRKIESLSSSLGEEKERVINIQKHYEKCKNALKDSEDENEGLKKENITFMHEKKTMGFKYSSLEAENTKLEKIIGNKNQEITGLEGELQQKSQKLSSLQKQLNALQNELSEVKEQNQQLENKLKKMEKEMESKTEKEDVRILNEEIEKRQDLIDQLSDQLVSNEQEYTSKIEQYEDLIKGLQEKNEEITKELEDLEDKNANLQSSFEELQGISDKLICDNSTLQRKVESLMEELDMNGEEGGRLESQDISERLAGQLERMLEIVNICLMIE